MPERATVQMGAICKQIPQFSEEEKLYTANGGVGRCVVDKAMIKFNQCDMKMLLHNILSSIEHVVW